MTFECGLHFHVVLRNALVPVLVVPALFLLPHTCKWFECLQCLFCSLYALSIISTIFFSAKHRIVSTLISSSTFTLIYLTLRWNDQINTQTKLMLIKCFFCIYLYYADSLRFRLAGNFRGLETTFWAIFFDIISKNG